MFDRYWWQGVVEAWNRGPHTGRLARLGKVAFEVLDEKSNPLQVLRFDQEGIACLDVCSPEEELPTFSSVGSTWIGFLQGEFTATQGVLSGRLRYKGALIQVLPFSTAFNDLAATVRGAGLVELGSSHEDKS
jgi:putative sterol carrier protein